jgi:menaquinone reductase, molybdopterin-binding-like subunit
MKLSRRCFLSLSIGGTVGTALTPLPWKLTDDLSIWSQNWTWTPVPPDGEYTFVNSTCTLCPGHCGIRVRKVDLRAVKIEGQNSGLCPLGFSGLQMLYGHSRVPGPLKRVGERGEGQWQSISWEQAITEVASRLAAIRSEGKPQSLACVASSDIGTVPWLFQRLLTAYGSPNFFRMPSVQDTHEAVLSMTQGINGFVGMDVENADFILSFGSALLDGYGSPPRMIRAVSRLKDQNGTLVQVEHRLSNTAAKADVWLASKPGTEADLALAMAHVIIERRRYHGDFVGSRTEGFNAFAAMVKERYTPESVAGVTGLSEEAIVRTALAFADAKRPLAIYGRGKGHVPGSLKEALAVNALNALVGNINQDGGVHAIPAYDYLDWPEVQTDATAAAGLQTTRIDGAGSERFPHSKFLVNRLIDAVTTSPGQVEALLVYEANPCYSLPDTAKVREAFGKIPFIVSFSSHMDETAMMADLILPNHMYLERYEDVPVMAGTTRPKIGLCQPVVAPQLNTRHAGDSIIQIAGALKGSVAAAFPWVDYERCLQETLGDQWDDMSDKGYWTAESGAQGSGGRFVFMDDRMGAVYLGETPVPSGGGAGFNLILVPYDSIRLSAQIGDPPFAMKIVPDTVLKNRDGFVELNPETAALLTLTEGQKVVLSTPVGSAQMRVHLDDNVMPGVLSMARGLGHTAYGPFVAGKGVNVNQLIAPVEDPASGLNTAWGIRARLAKA